MKWVVMITVILVIGMDKHSKLDVIGNASGDGIGCLSCFRECKP